MLHDTNSRPLLAGLGGQTPEGRGSDDALPPPDGGLSHPSTRRFSQALAPGVAVSVCGARNQPETCSPSEERRWSV
ncbi:MAG TPA: hypothetical protein VFU32_02180 [Ktedonobacterales bacterium]|nr:hypothetical protein [Ktedonobacterales bacterium]